MVQLNRNACVLQAGARSGKPELQKAKATDSVFNPRSRQQLAASNPTVTHQNHHATSGKG
jgi:hypothetical protein